MKQTDLFPFGPPNPTNQVTPFFIYGERRPGRRTRGVDARQRLLRDAARRRAPAPPPNAFSVTFAKPGKYHFICMLHGPDMAADIRVTS